MAYATPTTATEMYEILKQIYYDYRLRIDAYEDAGLEDLVLNRLRFIAKTDAQLLSDAKALVQPWLDEQFKKEREEIGLKIEVATEKKNAIDEKTQERLQALEKEVEEDIETIKDEALKKGYYNSDVTVSKIAEIQEYKRQRSLEIQTEAETQKTEAEQEIANLQAYYDSLEATYQEHFNNKVNAKIVELREQQEKTEREVFKYNNGLDEKEKRSRNANISANASLKLRYLEIRSKSYSKEELVDMGYYNDVINCVCGYYNTISNALTAYQKFLDDTKVIVYLEDFYYDVLTIYRSKAGL